MSLDHRILTVASADPSAEPQAVAWFQAVHWHFAEDMANDQQLRHLLTDAVEDGWRLRDVRDPGAPAYAVDGPVATFVTFDKTLNVGGGALLPVTCMTEVTVRATHRRRGLLRTMMTEELAAARDRGHALAALTATEATIYGRFGFGPTSHTQAVEVDTSHGFGLRHAPRGTTQYVDRETGARLGAEVFAEVHRTRFGSMDRVHTYAARRAGLIGAASGEPENGVRNAVHADESGAVDGWVAYSATAKGRVKVHELCAVTDDAYLGLWALLGATDLVSAVEWSAAPLDDPLPWALTDPRGHRVTATKDALWTRVLDPAALLGARGYAGLSGRLVVRVADPLGYADGTWEVEVDQGHARAAATTREPDLTCTVEELGPLVLGGVDPRVLAAAGRLVGEPEALERARALFGALGRPWTTTHF